MNVDKNLLRNKLTNLSEFSTKDRNAGMAIILSDQGLTSENFTDIPDDGEPFLFIVNVGQNESESRSCFRHHKFIRDMAKLEDFGREIGSTACDVVGMPLVVGSVVGALLLAVLIILYLVFRPKCRREGKPKRSTYMESTAVDNEFG